MQRAWFIALGLRNIWEVVQSMKKTQSAQRALHDRLAVGVVGRRHLGRRLLDEQAVRDTQRHPGGEQQTDLQVPEGRTDSHCDDRHRDGEHQDAPDALGAALPYGAGHACRGHSRGSPIGCFTVSQSCR